MNNAWQAPLENALGASVQQQTRLSGGDFADSQHIVLSDERHIFVKTHANPPPFFFTTEASGLGWLHDTQTVPTPKVLWVSDNPPCLALEWIPEGPRISAGEQEFGRRLAQLHQRPFACFGRPDHRTTGSLGVPNEPCEDWASFYSTQRIEPLLKLSEEHNALPTTTRQLIAKLVDQLHTFAPPTEAPCLVHGDLWAGNRIVDVHGVSWIIDPAAHGNHREFDLAMMRLFGGYDARCFDAYQEAYPLAAGWQQRVPLFQLAPLMVHAIKFGGHYAGATLDAVQSLR